MDILPIIQMSILNKSKKSTSGPPKIDDLVANRDHKTLIRMLEKEESEVFRLAAVMGLAKIGDKKAIKAISKALYDPKELVRWSAAYELVKVDAPYALLIIKSVFDDNEMRKFQLFMENMNQIPSQKT